ncbi:DUF2304 domain-containing protein [Paenibacillus sp. MMO-177]|uniref:DUF2304 domain-containing protein n=1 Tax=Paenibacillus sp. MMO-177 TaxID=3081289 RepID=UPI0030181275
MHNHDILRWFILLCGIAFAAVVIRLLLRQRINTRNSVSWLLGTTAILIISANPDWIDRLADLLGIAYPPTLLFLLSTLVLLVVVLYQSIQISILNEKMRQLAQHVALTDQERSAETRTESNHAAQHEA